MKLHLPDDAYLATLGRVAVRHAYMERAAKMITKTLNGLGVDEAMLNLRRAYAQTARDKVKQATEQRLGDTSAAERIAGYMKSWRELSEERNKYLHHPIASFSDGRVGYLNEENAFEPLPSIEVLNNLADRLYELAETVTRDRLRGFP